jgi:hypothetical protein
VWDGGKGVLGNLCEASVDMAVGTMVFGAMGFSGKGSREQGDIIERTRNPRVEVCTVGSNIVQYLESPC